jgi:ATP-dependent DNA ligase
LTLIQPEFGPDLYGWSRRLETMPRAELRVLHEVKHDGWRAQLHRTSANAFVLSRNGKGFLSKLGGS